MGCQTCEQKRMARDAKHFVQSAGKVVKAALTGGQVLVTKEQYKTRELVCEQCDQVSRKNGMPTGATILSDDKCQECGCKVLEKIKYATEACPLGKWMEIKNG